MRIYFTASIVGKKKYADSYRHIISLLTASGHTVTADHIMMSTEVTISLETEKQRERFHKTLRKWIMHAHAMVVETSFPSVSVGFEISLALQLNKPVLVLYQHEPPTLLSGYDDEHLVCEQYDAHSLKSILEDFMNYVGSQTEHRFTFFIPSDLNHFLEKSANKKNVPKSVFLRNLIAKAKDDADASH